jgi:hypothetical protein
MPNAFESLYRSRENRPTLDYNHHTNKPFNRLDPLQQNTAKNEKEKQKQKFAPR